MSQFAERISFISGLYISKIPLMLLMVVSCYVHGRSYVEWNKFSPHSYIKHNHNLIFLYFLTCLKCFPLPYYRTHSNFIYAYLLPCRT